jgi:hypothetical protein
VPAAPPVSVAASAPPSVSQAARGRREVPSFAGANSVAFAAAFPTARAPSLFSGSPSETALQGFVVVEQSTAETLDRRLDAQLNELQLDPHAFFHRLERVQERERFVQRLAERAARPATPRRSR